MTRLGILVFLTLTGQSTPTSDELLIPLAEGQLVLRDVRFIAIRAGEVSPELYFKIENHTKEPWWQVELKFAVTAVCRDQSRRWEIPATTSVGYSDDRTVANVYHQIYYPLADKVDGCCAETITAELDYAANGTHRHLGPERKRREAAERQKQKQLAAKDREREAAAEAQALEKRNRARSNCAEIYTATINKRIADLTVREEQQVRACQALGFYGPK